jgi:pyruvate formate lyase activating enzyme
MKEAMFYERLSEGRVRCYLCHHKCTIADGKRGICTVRENIGGTLYSLVYGKAISANIDPIEKKPLFHFLPGTDIYSFATVGCNFRCMHCQNYSISQMPRDERRIDGRALSPEEIVLEAKKFNCKSIAYTYTEPTIFYEYAYDTAKLAHKEGIKNVFVTNGYTGEDALREIKPYLDAANIDVKGFTEKFYKEICGARLEPVLNNVRLYKELGIWVEVTTLIIPTLNDSEEHIRGIAEFLVSVDENIPWHVTQFHPEYKLMSLPITPLKSLRKARKIGLEVGLKYVYEGNVPGYGNENTYCPNCSEILIKRWGFTIEENKIEKGRCPKCKTLIEGVWK